MLYLDDTWLVFGSESLSCAGVFVAWEKIAVLVYVLTSRLYYVLTKGQNNSGESTDEAAAAQL